MSNPTFHLTDDVIRAALTPAPEIRAPLDLASDIRLAIEPVAQRHPRRLAWRPSRQARLVLRIVLATALLLLLIATLLVVGSRFSPAAVSTYHGGPERTGIMPGPAPKGWPQIEEPQVSLNGPFGQWGPAVVQGLVLTGNRGGFVAANQFVSHGPVWGPVDVGASINSSLSVAGDLVLVGDDDGVLHALAVRDGSEAWSWSPSSPTPLQGSAAVVGDVAIVGNLGGDLAALDVAHGSPIWTTTVGGEISRAIAAADGVAYVGVGGATSETPGTIQARDIATGTLLWAAPLQPGNSTTPTVADGRVFVAGGLDAQTIQPHAVYAFDAKSGRAAWPVPWSSSTGQNLYIDSVADGLVVVGSSDGQLVALDAETGSVVWGPLEVGASASPNGAVVGPTLYAIVGGERLMALDLATGVQHWDIKVKGDPSAPTIVDGHILVNTSVGKLVWIAGGGPTSTFELPATGS